MAGPAFFPNVPNLLNAAVTYEELRETEEQAHHPGSPQAAESSLARPAARAACHAQSWDRLDAEESVSFFQSRGLTSGCCAGRMHLPKGAKVCWIAAGLVSLALLCIHLQTGTRRLRPQRAAALRESALGLHANVCWQPISLYPGMAAVDQGTEIGKVKYEGISDCTTACTLNSGCNSFTACGDWSMCFLKDKVLDMDNEPLEEVGGGCWSYTLMYCTGGSDIVVGPPISNSEEVTSTTLTTTEEVQESTSITLTTTEEAAPAVERSTSHPSTSEASAAATMMEAATLVVSDEDLATMMEGTTTPLVSDNDLATMMEAVKALTGKTTTTFATATTTTAAPIGIPLPGKKDLKDMRKAAKKADRTRYQWVMYRGFDWPSSADYGEALDADVETAKELCLQEGYVGFRFSKGKVLLLSSPRPFQREDLVFVGPIDGVEPVFYTLSPLREMAWQPAPGCDLPNIADAEVIPSADLEAVKRRAEQMGYAGFVVRGNMSHMKFTETPIVRNDLQCLDASACTAYLAAPHHRATGARPYTQTHKVYGSHCTPVGSFGNCAVSGCCAGEGRLCFERRPGVGRCARDCESSAALGTPSSCKVLGLVTSPKVSLFCFSIAQSGGDAMRLIDGQLKHGAGIAECDEFMVFSDARVLLPTGQHTVPLSYFEADPRSDTGMSTSTHYEAWLTIFDHFIWQQYDWIVQVDPSTLLFPRQLKYQLVKSVDKWDKFNEEERRGAYLATCPSGHVSMTGALQVISSRAVMMWNFKRGSCPSGGFFPADVWLQSCMSTLGATAVSLPIIQDATCRSEEAEPCSNFSFAAFHPLRTLHAMEECKAQAQDA